MKKIERLCKGEYLILHISKPLILSPNSKQCKAKYKLKQNMFSKYKLKQNIRSKDKTKVNTRKFYVSTYLVAHQ